MRQVTNANRTGRVFGQPHSGSQGVFGGLG
jgi:hypothetical protein